MVTLSDGAVRLTQKSNSWSWPIGMLVKVARSNWPDRVAELRERLQCETKDFNTALQLWRIEIFQRQRYGSITTDGGSGDLDARSRCGDIDVCLFRTRVDAADLQWNRRRVWTRNNATQHDVGMTQLGETGYRPSIAVPVEDGV